MNKSDDYLIEDHVTDIGGADHGYRITWPEVRLSPVLIAPDGIHLDANDLMPGGSITAGEWVAHMYQADTDIGRGYDDGEHGLLLDYLEAMDNPSVHAMSVMRVSDVWARIYDMTDASTVMAGVRADGLGACYPVVDDAGVHTGDLAWIDDGDEDGGLSGYVHWGDDAVIAIGDATNIDIDECTGRPRNLEQTNAGGKTTETETDR